MFTGGLGPTADDLTKETVAACYGDTLVFDESEWEKITGYFARSGRVTTPNNRKQAMVPVKGIRSSTITALPPVHGLSRRAAVLS